MRKLDQIPPAWGNAEPNDPDWKKDKLIAKLQSQGHRPISVGRGIVVLEQCEPGDDFPGGGSDEPIRLSVYPDPDAGFRKDPDYLYVHAGRMGLMDVYQQRGSQTYRCLTLEVELAAELDESDTLLQMATVLKLCRQRLSGYYMARTPNGLATAERDDELEELGQAAVAAVERYRARLQTRPDLFRGTEP